MALVELALADGESFERGIQLAVQAVLVSPQFLFRVELDARPRGTARRRGAGRGSASSRSASSSWPRGSRISSGAACPTTSCSAWPARASSGRRRCSRARSGGCSAIPKARALVENFAGQWLQLRNLRTISPDRERFPGFDEPLREAMIRETELFFAAIIREDRSILDFLDADFTYVNERLARHYGIAGRDGRRVPPGSPDGSPSGAAC